MANYWKSEDEWIYKTIKELISKYHTDIAEAKVGVIFKEKASGDEDHQVLASIHKVSDKLRACGVEWDFVIEISANTWNDLTPLQREALLMHELKHAGCKIDEEDAASKKYVIVKHDLEEFREVVEKYGFWKTDVKKFADSVKKVKE